MRGPIGGSFAWDVTECGPLLLIAGGSGVVPLMAMLRHRARADAAARARVPARLLYSARTLDDVIYRDELARLAEAPDVAVVLTLTRGRPDGWLGPARRIDRAMLADVGWPAGAAPRAFVCGPTRLVESVATPLVELGHAPDRVRTDGFGPTG